MKNVTEELIPAMRQSLEEVLVDTANVLAEPAAVELLSGTIARGDFAKYFNKFRQRHINAKIGYEAKPDSNLLVYITDEKGRVVYDSSGENLGKDYSQWNDVYLTLRGRYGARTTRSNPADPTTSVMYVAAPIKHREQIIGVLSVGKPSTSVQPFFISTVRKIETKVLILLLVSFVLVTLIVYWLTLSIRKLTRYARAVQEGKRVKAPSLREKELAQLAHAMEDMRGALEGKEYVENYLHTLTHELKSPLAAIQGAAELLREEMPLETRKRFIDNIANESLRLREVVEELLKLAALEKRQGLDQIESIRTDELIRQLCEDKTPVLQQKELHFDLRQIAEIEVEGERFLLQQAISNVLDNAIDFSPVHSEIHIRTAQDGSDWTLIVRDHGPGIPDFALPRIFERFYSLPRPGQRPKSTGLGLSLVKEVVQLHRGSIDLQNHQEGGVELTLKLPLLQS